MLFELLCLTLNPVHKSFAVQNEDHGRSRKGVAESEGGGGTRTVKKFDGAGVQAKSGSANVDVEVEVIFWFHCALVSSPSKEESKVSRSRPFPRRFVSFVERLLAVRTSWADR